MSGDKYSLTLEQDFCIFSDLILLRLYLEFYSVLSNSCLTLYILSQPPCLTVTYSIIVTELDNWNNIVKTIL